MEAPHRPWTKTSSSAGGTCRISTYVRLIHVAYTAYGFCLTRKSSATISAPKVLKYAHMLSVPKVQYFSSINHVPQAATLMQKVFSVPKTLFFSVAIN
eukprot:7577827-Ditylum_brightwellii.AAC.1